MGKNRPRFLNLWQIRLPLNGIVSIVHRVSGVFLFLALPFLFYLLELSLSSRDGFAQATAITTLWPVRLFALLLLWLFAHHLFAGVRIMLIDMEVGSELHLARRSAALVLVLALIVLLGCVVL